jgi:hypothetical protein
MTHNLEELVENNKRAAATLIDRSILNLPEGISHGASRMLVDLIVGAALLEITMMQSKAMKDKP